MENGPFEVPAGEPAALPTRPKNRHKRERDVSHLCPTAVRLAQRREEIVKAWREQRASPARARAAVAECSHRFRGILRDQTPRVDAKEGTSYRQGNPSPQPKYSIVEEYTVSDEDYSNNEYEICNEDGKPDDDTSEDDSFSDADSQGSDSVSSSTVDRTYYK